MRSQNGWPASADRAAIGVTAFVVAGVSFPGGVRSGDVATVLGHVATEFHRRVEPLVAGWCWGHHYRAVTGGSALSNHASGTAIDTNSPRHPIGERGTFTAAQVRQIRAILAECDGAVRWGGDYSRPDDMHFEINAGPAKVAQVARNLSSAGGSTEEDDVMRFDDRDSQPVRDFQRLLNHFLALSDEAGWAWTKPPLTVDGHFGPATRERYQHAIGRAQKYLESPSLIGGNLNTVSPTAVAMLQAAAAQLAAPPSSGERGPRGPEGPPGQGLTREDVKALVEGARIEGVVRLGG